MQASRSIVPLLAPLEVLASRGIHDDGGYEADRKVVREALRKASG